MKQNRPPFSILTSRLKLVFIVSLFLGPLAAAFIWYYGLNARSAPSAQSNHAPLIQPAVRLGAFDNPLHESGEVTFDSLKKIWTIVHVVDNGCDAGCQNALYNTRQVRIAAGRDGSRIQRFLLVKDAGTAESIRAEHPDAKILIVTGRGLGAQVLKIIDSEGLAPHDAVLIDPLGNVMMAVPDDLDPRLLLKDLKKLLKVSRIG